MSDQRRPGPSLALSLIVLGVGVVVGVVGLVEAVVPFVRTLTQSATYSTPATIHARLSNGSYEIYQLTSRRSSGFSPVQPGHVDIQPTDVTVTSSSGATIATATEAAAETLTHGNDVYTGAVRFEVPAAGTYEVRVHTDNGSPTRVILARSLGGIARSVVGWIITGAAGGLLAAIGLVLLIVGLVRRRQRPTAYTAAGTLPAANWYPDPSEPSQQRYWDGTQWTDQTHRS